MKLMRSGATLWHLAASNKAIELDPQYAMAYIIMALAYRELKQYDMAVTDCTKAIEIDPKSALAYFNRGHAYLNMGKQKEAEADFAKAKMLHEGN